ncbi:TonB-dependent receptor domain-containing protein [Sphingobium sp. KCTC 72723]|uniref:TonB-dependent receptor domain-containing protein n=1 Tax=Sphingobium sp. KCTC 72723 TaxID=2733867 RepID=UPI00165E593B|nr:TonB-dependent receptor [Sphingobium sp. KCTC 72723]
MTLYGSYRTGYKSGGYSISGLITRNTTASDPAFAPEKVKGFEAGVKATLMDNQLRINADVFSYKYRNLQVDYLDPTLIQFFTLNAAALRTRGGEMQVEFAPRAVSELRLRGSIGYIDAKYTSFPFAPCLSTQTVAQGCVFGPAPSGSRFSQDLSGERPPQAPKWTASLSADYTVPLANDYEIALSMNTRYSSSYSTNPFVNSYLAAAFNQKKFATIDASFRLNAPEQRWSISLVGKNLTNHFIATTASNVPFTAGSVRSSVLDPRTVAVQAEFHF